MALKDIVRKAGGLLFEDVGGTLDPKSGGALTALPDDLLKQLNSGVTLSQMNQQMPGASASDIQIGTNQASVSPETTIPKAPAAPIVTGDIVDFSPIYVEAGLPPVALTAEDFLKMVEDLGDIPLPAKRTMIGTMLNAMSKSTPGVNSASIANDALLKIKSLSVYNEGVKNQLVAFVTAREKSIADARAKITLEETTLKTAQDRVAKITEWCEREGNKLDDALEFFSADSGASKLAPTASTTPDPFKL
jgi:hypothetical protein